MSGPIYYARIKKQVMQKSELIWEDSNVLFEWTRFFDRLHYLRIEGDEDKDKDEDEEDEEEEDEDEDEDEDEGRDKSYMVGSDEAEWTAFLSEREATTTSQTGHTSRLKLDASKEQHLHEIRQRNRIEFDANFGLEEYLLDDKGRAVLESHVDYRTDVSREETAANLPVATRVPIPRIFQDWTTDTNMGHAEQYDRSLRAAWREMQPIKALPLTKSSAHNEHNDGQVFDC